MQLNYDETFRISRIPVPSSAETIETHDTSLQKGTSHVAFKGFLNEGRDEEYLLKCPDYNIRLVDSPRQRSKAGLLIKRMYSWRGYTTDDSAVIPHNAHHLTLEASSKQQLFGTLTLGIDSAKGLAADELYKEELNFFRKKGRKICEVSKLAIDPQFSSKELFASLFHLTYIYAYTLHKVKDAFIEVNPRHAAFYKRMLGFKQIGEKRTCPRVDAPAVLLHLDLDYMDAQISSLAGSCELKDRSLYSYFFPRHKEKEVAQRFQHWLN
jgi:hypothetical protein